MEPTTAIGIGLAALVVAVLVAFTVVGLIEVVREKSLDALSRALWVVALLVLPGGGVLVWFIVKPRGLREFVAAFDRTSDKWVNLRQSDLPLSRKR